ncbi:MAG TPA: hypothetical protein VH796_18005 [Nitrososphaeraceae archaeon]|jgi:hypothetical protein
MTVRIDLGREVRASIPRVLEYFMNVEELPHIHPEYIKNVTVISKKMVGENNDASIEFEQEGSFHGKKIKSINRLTKFSLENAIKIETIDGNGKGSLTTIRCIEIGAGNTQIKLNSELHYGLLEKLLSRSIHAITEKTLEEDIKNIEHI